MTQSQLDKKFDNLQGQIDLIQRGDTVFKGYVHRQFGIIVKTMATKEDLRDAETRIVEATNEVLGKVKKEISELKELTIKIAKKIGVN